MGLKRRQGEHAPSRRLWNSVICNLSRAFPSPNGVLSRFLSASREGLELFIKIGRLLALFGNQSFFEPYEVLRAKVHLVILLGALLHTASGVAKGENVVWVGGIVFGHKILSGFEKHSRVFFG